MIIFLDFDGVLHPFPEPQDRSQLFCYLPRLESVVRDYPETRIVISSTWSEKYSISDLRDFFSHDVANKIIGVLPATHPRNYEDLKNIRLKQIEKYLEALDEKWVALDDDPDLFSENCENLIQCSEGFGTDEEVKLRAVLSSAASIV